MSSMTQGVETLPPLLAATVVLENVSDAFIAFDRRWRFVYVNVHAEQLLGISRDDLLGHELWTRFPEAKRSAFGRAYIRAVAENVPVEVEDLAPGLGRWLSVRAVPSNGVLCVCMQDITRRKRAEEARRKSETALRTLFAHCPEAVLLTTPEGGIVLANRAACAMFGRSEEELIAAGRSAVVDTNDPAFIAAFRTRSETGAFSGRLRMLRRDGTPFPVELTSNLFEDEEGQARTSIFIRDRTEEVAREAERERLHAAIDAERRWLQAALDHAPAAMLLYRRDGRLSFNRRAEELLGLKLSADGGSAQYAARILDRDGRPVPRADLPSSRVLERGETVQGAEYIVERPEGAPVRILGSAAPIYDANHAALGGIGVFLESHR